MSIHQLFVEEGQPLSTKRISNSSSIPEYSSRKFYDIYSEANFHDNKQSQSFIEPGKTPPKLNPYLSSTKKNAKTVL